MRIRFVYPSPMSRELEVIQRGEAPTDRMYGLLELQRAGHTVHFSDSRFEAGPFDRLRRGLRPVANLMDLETIQGLGDDDVVVVKDEFSTMLTAACRRAGTPIVYLDAMFGLPTRVWRKAATRLNLSWADGHVAYSAGQIATWSEHYGLEKGRFTFLPYCIDMAFYRRPERQQAGPYVLSVGRDLGRDFRTLIAAMTGTNLNLKLVTLPYTLRGLDVSASWIEVLQHISYEALFQLYANAAIVVIPLKPGVTYPSGIRALLEALALGTPVVCSGTEVLAEYVPEGAGVAYVPTDDVPAMRQAIESLWTDAGRRQELEQVGPGFVRARYDIGTFVGGLERYLHELVKG